MLPVKVFICSSVAIAPPTQKSDTLNPPASPTDSVLV